MDKYIGFDVSDKKTMACLTENITKSFSYQTLPTDPDAMAEWLTKQRKSPQDRLHLTFEVSGQAGWLYDKLANVVDSITVSNPYELTWVFRTHKKTDRVDARKQAKLLLMDEIPAVHMPQPEVRQWRGQILHRRKLISCGTQVKNQIRALLKSQGHRQGRHGSNWWTKKNRQWLEEIAASEEGVWCLRLVDMLEELALYEGQVKRVTAMLDARLREHSGGALLMSIPGVGPRTAEAVLAYTDEVNRFRRGKEFCSYFGMTPKLDQSGAMCRHGHISKRGPSVVRWLVTESAWRAVRKSAALREFYERVQRGQSQRKKIAIVAVARKILSIMRALLVTGEEFNETLVLEQEQQVRGRGIVRRRFYN